MDHFAAGVDLIDIRGKAERLTAELVAWRRAIHARPELSFREFQTAEFVARTLGELGGVDLQTGVGGTGVVATIRGGPGPTIAVRADMDALPIRETTDRPFRSTRDGVMHACGHDAHAAMLLGTARLLHESRGRRSFPGTVKLLFQPAEEAADADGLTGAVHMIRAGVLDDVDAAIALHVNPERPVGTIWANDGYTMANVDTFEGRIFAAGGHAAYAHLGVDPTWMLSAVLQSLHAIVSRKISPLDAAVVSVGEIHAGTASNVLPNEIVLRGTLRSYRPDVRERLIDEVKASFAVVDHLGARHEVDVVRGEPALYNDPTVNRSLVRAACDLFPEARVEERPFGLGGEDFGHMTERVPGAMLMLGCALPDGIERSLHTSVFDIDERVLPFGAAALALAALRFVSGEWTIAEKPGPDGEKAAS